MPDRFLHAVRSALECDFKGCRTVSVKTEAVRPSEARVGGYGATSQEDKAASMMAAIIVESPIRISGFSQEKANLIAAMRAASRYAFTDRTDCPRNCSWGREVCVRLTPEFGNPCYRAFIDQWIERHAAVDLSYKTKLPEGLSPRDWLRLCSYFADMVKLHKGKARAAA